jgi:hypothetical protein
VGACVGQSDGGADGREEEIHGQQLRVPKREVKPAPREKVRTQLSNKGARQ